MSRKHGTAYSLFRLLPLIAVAFAIQFCAGAASAQQAQPKFKVIAIAEKGGIHKPYVDAAKVWLAREAIADGAWTSSAARRR